MSKSLPLIAAAAMGASALSSPASAQEAVQSPDDRYNMVIVYGDDECPQSTEEQIVVCARKAEQERYRIPERLRFSSSPENQAWAQRVERLEMVGKFGTMSCSPTGAGGFTGCTQEMIANAYADKAQGSEVRFSALVNQARSERLEGVDEEARIEQERVEMIEREYMERLERERAGEVAPVEAEPLPSPEG